MHFITLLLPLLFLTSTYATTATEKSRKTLVLLDDASTTTTNNRYSKLLDSLKSRGHQLTIRSADDPSLSLSKYGEYLYDNLLILSPGVEEFGGSITPSAIASFVDDAGGNVLIAADPSVGHAIRESVTEFGIEIQEEDSAVAPVADSKSTSTAPTVKLDPQIHLLPIETIVGKSSSQILYRGIALSSSTTQQKSSTLPLLPLLVSDAQDSHVIHLPSQSVLRSGSPQVLVYGLQTRNNARIIVSGSVDFWSDEFWSNNSPLVSSLTQWLLKEKGVLRFSHVSHWKVGSSVDVDGGNDSTTTTTTTAYTVTDDVVYSIRVETLDFANNKWIPFVASDLQLEFVRIDPFVRIGLEQRDAASGAYVAQFKVPDVYGVFKFVVDYNRLGWTHLYSSTQVSVIPLRHTQYERFIRSAAPYYVSAFSMMIGVFFFSILFLYHRSSGVSGGSEKEKLS